VAAAAHQSDGCSPPARISYFVAAAVAPPPLLPHHLI
jgi:hypothetical protein